MSTETLIFIILAGIAALFLALFQYIYKSTKSKNNIVYAILRFFTFFLILLLIINPKFESKTVTNQKPKLAVVIDNSESIEHLNQVENAKSTLNQIQQNNELKDKFDIDYYTFGNTLNSLDSLSFNEKQSNISSVFKNLKQIYKNAISPTILITDGNQTYGSDFEFESNTFYQPTYPVILGDTIIKQDLKIQQLNVNKYVFLDNKFLVELVAIYNGNQTVKTKLQIGSGRSIIYSKTLEFSKTNKSHSVLVELDAKRVGVQVYNATLVPLEFEQNKANNSKQFAIEVIDEKTNVAIVSDILHPDLGALKKAIESNQQREASILKPTEFLNTSNAYQLTILYQPNSSFNAVYERINTIGINKLVITGLHTQWNFINQIQSYYTQEITNQYESYQPSLNSGFNTFSIENFNFNDYPPLESEFGDISFDIPTETILFKSINGRIIERPLLLTIEDNQKREALLNGEGIWKWRAHNYLKDTTFEDFDTFLGKLIQYLASNKRTSRLVIDYESFYQGNENITISSQYYNKNYEFDNNANLEIKLENKNTKEKKTLPLILNNANYSVTLKDLEPSIYKFSIHANTNEFVKSGNFTLLEYNVEKQFLNANVNKLQEVAKKTNGNSIFFNDTEKLLEQLVKDNKYVTIQKSSKKIVPLIDFKYLLLLIALSLAIEWFLRKYNGLI
ncbi:MAG: VWA domain-containing protein [Flavobacteriaceae bacterium]|nr:VWA domain-containing protein [Flavobacteriaceae bacterium]